MLREQREVDGLGDGAETHDADTQGRRRLRPALPDRCLHPRRHTQFAGTFALSNQEVKRRFSPLGAQSIAQRKPRLPADESGVLEVRAATRSRRQ